MARRSRLLGLSQVTSDRERERGFTGKGVGCVIEEGTDRYLVSRFDDISKYFMVRLVLVRKDFRRRKTYGLCSIVGAFRPSQVHFDHNKNTELGKTCWKTVC